MGRQRCERGAASRVRRPGAAYSRRRPEACFLGGDGPAPRIALTGESCHDIVSLANCCRWRIEWLRVISSRLSVPVAAPWLVCCRWSRGWRWGIWSVGSSRRLRHRFSRWARTAIDLIPLQLKDFAVRTFGSDDKVALLSGMAVVIGLVGVVAGLLSRRSRRRGLVLLTLRGVVASVAVTMTRVSNEVGGPYLSTTISPVYCWPMS
jgi:hypothetical protein